MFSKNKEFSYITTVQLSNQEINIKIMLFVSLRSRWDFVSCSSSICHDRRHPGSCNTFCCPASRGPFHLEPSLSPPWSFTTLTAWNRPGLLFCRIPSIQSCPVQPHKLVQVMHFWQEYHGDATFFSLHLISRYMMLTYPVMDKVSLIIWLRWCLLDFSFLKLPFCLCNKEVH